jgi:hypothetical protein
MSRVLCTAVEIPPMRVLRVFFRNSLRQKTRLSRIVVVGRYIAERDCEQSDIEEFADACSCDLAIFRAEKPVETGGLIGVKHRV